MSILKMYTIVLHMIHIVFNHLRLTEKVTEGGSDTKRIGYRN